MRLFYSSAACSLAPHIALHEAGISFTPEKVNLKDKTWREGDFRKVSPKGYVPTLQLDNGEIMSECAALMQYIADLAPAKNLMPKAGDFARYRCIEWLTFVSTELHKGFGPLWKSGVPEDFKKATTETLRTRFELLDNHFNDHDWLLGKTYSVADAYLFTVINWSNFLKLDMSMYTALNRFMAWMTERPAVQAALKAEGLLK